jgi:hypothetical protein
MTSYLAKSSKSVWKKRVVKYSGRSALDVSNNTLSLVMLISCASQGMAQGFIHVQSH